MLVYSLQFMLNCVRLKKTDLFSMQSNENDVYLVQPSYSIQFQVNNKTTSCNFSANDNNKNKKCLVQIKPDTDLDNLKKKENNKMIQVCM